MPPVHRLALALPLAGLITLLAACRKEVPTPPVPPAEPTPKAVAHHERAGTPGPSAPAG